MNYGQVRRREQEPPVSAASYCSECRSPSPESLNPVGTGSCLYSGSTVTVLDVSVCVVTHKQTLLLVLCVCFLDGGPRLQQPVHDALWSPWCSWHGSWRHGPRSWPYPGSTLNGSNVRTRWWPPKGPSALKLRPWTTAGPPEAPTRTQAPLQLRGERQEV